MIVYKFGCIVADIKQNAGQRMYTIDLGMSVSNFWQPLACAGHTAEFKLFHNLLIRTSTHQMEHQAYDASACAMSQVSYKLASMIAMPLLSAALSETKANSMTLSGVSVTHVRTGPHVIVVAVTEVVPNCTTCLC